jgi:hypothetical protein
MFPLASRDARASCAVLLTPEDVSACVCDIAFSHFAARTRL